MKLSDDDLEYPAMTQVSPDMVERAAKAIDPTVFKRARKCKIENCEDCILELEDLRSRARSVLTAALGDKYVIVPKEPTPAHIEAAHKAKIFLNMTDGGWAKAYRAMIAAAPTPEQQQP